jgi:hypothetical protein
MMRVFYGSAKGNAHRYQCRGDDAHVGAGLCIGIGGVRTDRAVACQILEAVSNHAVEAAILASSQAERSSADIIAAVDRDLEAARYEVSIAARRYELVDPAKRHVARELEARWNAAGETHPIFSPARVSADQSGCYVLIGNQWWHVALQEGEDLRGATPAG